MTMRRSAAVPAAVRRADATVGTYPECGAGAPAREKPRSREIAGLKETAR